MYSISLYLEYPLQVMIASSSDWLATPTIGRLETCVALSVEVPNPVEEVPVSEERPEALREPEVDG